MGLAVRDAVDADVAEMTAIYNSLIETTTIEWTDQLHTVEARLEWQHQQAAAGFPVLVAVSEEGSVVGWTSYGDFRDTDRWPGYLPTVEHSIHIHVDWWGRGVGRALMEELVQRARAAGKHVMVAGIDGENVESIRFHERLGFELVGRLPEIGRKHGRWLDLVLMQRRLDDGSAAESIDDPREETP